jgi:hypothetical protein
VLRQLAPGLIRRCQISSFVAAVTSHLATLENTAAEHIKLGDDLQAQVIDELKRSERKKEDNRKKVGTGSSLCNRVHVLMPSGGTATRLRSTGDRGAG